MRAYVPRTAFVLVHRRIVVACGIEASQSYLTGLSMLHETFLGTTAREKTWGLRMHAAAHGRFSEDLRIIAALAAPLRVIIAWNVFPEAVPLARRICTFFLFRPVLCFTAAADY